MSDHQSLWIGLPERLDRKLHLGPFPSAQDALKFVTYAAVGALVAALTSPIYWLPFLGVGLLVSIPRIDGRTVDGRMADYFRWRLRRGEHPSGASGPPERVRPNVPFGSLARIRPGRYVSVLVTHGVPSAFLPLAGRRSLFERYKALLRSLDTGCFVSVGLEPLDPGPFLPPDPTPPTRIEGARADYAQLVRAACRRKYRRRTRWVLWSSSMTPESCAELEARTRDIMDHLLRLEVPFDRLEGPALGQALESMGWSVEGRR
jgi:hypothetical protein